MPSPSLLSPATAPSPASAGIPSTATSFPSAGSPSDPYAPFPCQTSVDVDLWFAERTADVERAKALCRTCPIREECLDGAIARAEPWGVWGGQVFVDGTVVPTKRGRGRPRRVSVGPEHSPTHGVSLSA